MNKKNVALAIIMGLSFAKGVFAADPETEKEEFDLNSIEFIEEESVVDFDAAKYLPVGFDAYAIPTGIEGINYIDENDTVVLDFNAKQYLPKGFNPYKK